MAVNPFSYTSRDYSSILAELNTLFPNKPEWFKTSIAGLFSIAHWYLDARAQNLLLSTAFTEEAILNLCAFLDYYPKNLSPSSGQLVVKLKDTTTLPYVLSKSLQTFYVSPSTVGGRYQFEGVGDVTFAGKYAKVPVIQGTPVSAQTIGTSDGSKWQEMAIYEDDLQIDTVRIALVLVESPLTVENWTVVDTLINSSPTDKHVRIIKKPEGIIVAQFGDGVYGKIPPNGLRVITSYTYGGGIAGNFKAGNTVVPNSNIGVSNGAASQEFYINANLVISSLLIKIDSIPWVKVSDISLSASNAKHYQVTLQETGINAGKYKVLFGDGVNGEIPANAEIIYASYSLADNATVTYGGTDTEVESAYLYEDFSGGGAAESLERSKVLAPISIKTKERAVLEDDFEYLSKRYSTSVIAAKCLPFYYGLSTVGIHVIPSGGGYPATPLKTGLQDYIKARTTLKVLDVRVRNPLYVPNPADSNVDYQTLTIDSAMFLRSGYSTTQYYAYGLLVLRLIVSETTTEILDIYESEGIQSVIDFINNKWIFGTYVFGTDDYSEVTGILERRKKDGVVLWGGRLRPNDIISALSDLTGVDYVTVTTPASIITLPFDRVFTDAGTTFNLTVS